MLRVAVRDEGHEGREEVPTEEEGDEGALVDRGYCYEGELEGAVADGDCCIGGGQRVRHERD